MKKRWKLGLLLTLLLLFGMQMTVLAAGETVTINSCVIQGDQVVVVAGGSKVAPSDDGNYYLFALENYEAGVGARTDYCAAAPAAAAVTFTTPLQLDTAASKLYCRFVVTALRGGQFVPVSTEMYILNPEAVAKASTASIAEATGNKKGLILDWRDGVEHLSDLGAGYAAMNINMLDAFGGNDFAYEYNGKTFFFSRTAVDMWDAYVNLFRQQNVDIVAIVYCELNANTAELVYPEALLSSKHYNAYAINVENQVVEEKMEAIMSLIAERYSGGSHGSIHNYVIGNEVNSSNTWHYAGEIPVGEFARRYAKEFRTCYNAIKSHNLGANVYICTDQRWLHNDGGSSYGGKPVIDGFAAEINRTGNINWGLSFHPYPVPLTYAPFWTTAPGYGGLVNHTEKTRMIIPTNMEVVTNYMTKPEMLAPATPATPNGSVRNIIISEVGFNSAGANTNEGIQAAAIVYAFKLVQANPYIKCMVLNRLADTNHEMRQGLANGLMRPDGSQKPAYAAFKNMDKLGMEEYLPYIGASSWAQLGVK